MGADISKQFSDDFLKKKGGFLGFGGNAEKELYSMKIILRGAEGVGKTSLFEVFQGRSCPEEHKPSKQIKTTNVLWTNPISKERVKIEIWDIVDKAGINTMDQVAIEKIAEMKKKGGVASGKIVFQGMDASSVDVYEGCNACVFIIDPRNLDSVEYFKQTIVSVPMHIPVLVIANFRDVQGDWKISTEELQTVIDAYKVNTDDAASSTASMDEFISEEQQFKKIMHEVYSGNRRVIKLIETSFLEKFGLHSLYLFLTEPFYFVRLVQLRNQIIMALANLKQANDDFDDYVKSSTYEVFLQLRKEYEEKLKEEERLRQEQLKQEQQQAAASEPKEGIRKVFGKKDKKGNRIKSNDRKNYATLAVTPGGEASDSENEIEEVPGAGGASLAMQNMDDFYNDQSSEKTISRTIRNIEIEQLLKSDSLESPYLEPSSSSNSILHHHRRSRQDSMDISFEGASLSSRSVISDDDSDSNSVVIHQHSSSHTPREEALTELEEHTQNEREEHKEVMEDKKEEDETPVLPADFSEDFNVRFRSVSMEVHADDGGKRVSMGARLKNVWNRKTNEETKVEKDKKKEGDERMSKFSKLLPMNKKRDGVEGDKENGDLPNSSQELVTATTSVPNDEIKEMGGKKKWEIDRVKRMLSSFKTNTAKNSQIKEKAEPLASIPEETTKNETTKLVVDNPGGEEKEEETLA